MGNDDPREEVPMTAETIDDVWTRTRGRDWTWADLQEIPDDGHRYEVIDGSLYVSPSPSRPHQVAAARLVQLLQAAAPDDVEVVETVDVQLDRSVLEPDVVVMPTSVAYTADGPLAPGDVLLAVEVVSPASRWMDRMVKPSVLAEAGVPAYWPVELEGPDAPSITAFSLADGIYREVATVRAGEAVVVDVPFPVELRPAELAGPRRRS
jgi:Uma2 family endonuclease